jgi:DNA (cytosine-5)-methyltransferase 1
MRLLELFSGAGGFAKGLEKAGFNHIALVEIDKHACASLRQNFDKNIVYENDIKALDFSDFSGIDVIAGGPPCQPFSLAGKHQAEQDSRDMFPYAIDAIEKLKPKAFIFENVKGLLRPSFTDYFEYIILRLTYPHFGLQKTTDWKEHLLKLRTISKLPYTATSYNVSYQLLNAANYGVPQLRERVLIVGIRSDLNLEWVFPEGTHSKDSLFWDMFVTNDYWTRHNIPKLKISAFLPQIEQYASKLNVHYGLFKPRHSAWLTIRDALMDIPDPRESHNIVDHLFKKGARTYKGHTGSDIDFPSKTIKAGTHGVPGGENMIRYEDGTVRYLSVFEAKRIQTFPDDFVIEGAWGEAMRQIGNAVPVRLGEIIGKQMINIFRKTHSNKLFNNKQT